MDDFFKTTESGCWLSFTKVSLKICTYSTRVLEGVTFDSVEWFIYNNEEIKLQI
jgi:hypothetical protein